MLTKFSVSNFKSFNSEFVFDLQNSNGYTFNQESVKDGVVNNAIIYGLNGVGKSNLGLAIFDLVGHLTNWRTDHNKYSNYHNAYHNSDIASFKYEFLINSTKITYEYKKKDYRNILLEKFSINGVEMAFIDREKSNEATIKFKGAESLKTTLANRNLSLLKYIRNSTILDKNIENTALLNFFQYIDGMLFFRSVEHFMFIGLEFGIMGSIDEDIIERGNVSGLEAFLNEGGIKCKLGVRQQFDKKIIVVDFNGKSIPFFEIASTGTKSLVLLYFWMQRLKGQSSVTFLFIDEFDAFYHHELSALVVKELKKSGVQFILTTHNTSIISNDLLRPDCYFLMKEDSIKPLSKRISKELREAHNIEKMYKAHSFNE